MGIFTDPLLWRPLPALPYPLVGNGEKKKKRSYGGEGP